MDRIEKDPLGEMALPSEAYYGIQTARAIANFPLSGYRLHTSFITAYAYVKKACALTNKDTGFLSAEKADAIVTACDEIIAGKWHDHIIVDAFQGGAGTSANMNMNEVIANRAGELLGGTVGVYDKIHPLHDVNMHQSTNDTFPTALRVAVLFMLQDCEKSVSGLQESLQKKEQEFASIVKLGRTELQDAVPMTLGMEFGAWGEATARDRWRIFKSRERIKTVNLGGTAIGTGLGAPRDYIFKVVDRLKQLTGLTISRAENLVDATQNSDQFAEISGILKACASNLLKISNDLRLLSSGPHGGFAEISLPAMQAGSTIMPGKVNPVICEAVAQAALRVITNDQIIALAAGLGNLELNQNMPLICHTMLESLTLLTNASAMLDKKCVQGIVPNKSNCQSFVDRSSMTATVLVPILGYETVERFVKEAESTGRPVRDVILESGVISKEKLNELLSPATMYKLGFTKEDPKQ